MKEFFLNTTEKGNTLLVHIDENWMSAWIRLEQEGELSNWLQISLRSCNYPALNVSTVIMSDRQLAKHIRRTFGPEWIVKKMNLSVEGVVDQVGDVIPMPDQEEVTLVQSPSGAPNSSFALRDSDGDDVIFVESDGDYEILALELGWEFGGDNREATSPPDLCGLAFDFLNENNGRKFMVCQEYLTHGPK